MTPDMTTEQLQKILEAALMVAGRPLSLANFASLFPETDEITNQDLKDALAALKASYAERGFDLFEVSGAYRLKARAEYSAWLAKLWEERPPRYSRAFLETLSIIAYKQPITRAEIEEIRGVTVSTNIVKTLQEREWIRIIGYKEVPGKPAIYGTTKEFLDYFNLKSLSDLPTLAEFKNLEAQEASLQVQLAMENSNLGPSDSEVIPEERDALIEQEENVAKAEIIQLSDRTEHDNDTNELEVATGQTNS